MQNARSQDAQASGACLPQNGMILCLEIDTRVQPCVNLDFATADLTQIPLHLSVRRDAELVVVNQFTARGWCRELSFRRVLNRPVLDIELAFGLDLLGRLTVGLWLNGALLARLDAYPRPDRNGPKGVRRGFPALGRIARMTWPSGLRSMRCLYPDRAVTPTLTERLEFVWNTAGQTAVLDLHDDEPPMDCLSLSGAGSPASRGLRIARLPGRIWCDADGGKTRVSLRMAGQSVEVPVDTRMILERLHSPEALWQMQNDPLVRLHMLEHVQHARLWPRLSGQVRETLGATARELGNPGFQPPVRTPVLRTVTSYPRDASQSCDAFHAQIANTAGTAPEKILDGLVCQDRLPPTEVRQLALMLSEWFCIHGDPLDLAALAARHGAPDWANSPDAWASIASLPMLWAQGNWAATEAALRGYPRQSSHWLVTPALGWVATALAARKPALDGSQIPEARRVSVMTALLELVADLAPSYWAQTRCTRVIAGVLDILAELPLLPDWCADWYVELSLRAYGLSPEFWDMMSARPALMEQPALAQAAQGFAALRNALASGKGAVLWEAARPFLLRRSAGHEMLRRVILSPPSQIASFGRRPDLAALSPVLSRQETEETALRWLSFPRSADTRAEIDLQPGEPLHIAACKGLRGAATAIPRPLLTQAGLRLGNHVHDSLAQLRQTGSLTPRDVRNLVHMASALCVREADFIGVPAMLAVTETASRQGAPALAQVVCRALCDALEPLATDDLLVAQAPRLALARFRDCCADERLHALLDRWLGAAHDAPADEDPVAMHLRAASNPFADTLVALISCHANLGSRAQDCRVAWGEDLARLGIPLVTVVGREAGQPEGAAIEFDGSLLRLDVPDSYEALPQKTLALAQWVRTCTGFSRVLKVDDDCLLNAKAYFSPPYS